MRLKCNSTGSVGASLSEGRDLMNVAEKTRENYVMQARMRALISEMTTERGNDFDRRWIGPGSDDREKLNALAFRAHRIYGAAQESIEQRKLVREWVRDWDYWVGQPNRDLEAQVGVPVQILATWFHYERAFSSIGPGHRSPTAINEAIYAESMTDLIQKTEYVMSLCRMHHAMAELGLTGTRRFIPSDLLRFSLQELILLDGWMAGDLASLWTDFVRRFDSRDPQGAKSIARP